MNSIVNKPSLLETEILRFLVMDSPKESNIHLYLQECKKYNVKHIVRISEPTYNKEPFENAGISVNVSLAKYLGYFGQPKSYFELDS